MALRRLLNNQVQVIRGGHGWDRPDVPVELNPTYVHRREIVRKFAIYIIHFIQYDKAGIQPTFNLIVLNKTYQKKQKQQYKQSNIYLFCIFQINLANKLTLSIFDTNMWMYDQVFPEYIISYNEMHLRDPWNGIKESLSQSAYIWLIMAMISGFYYINTSPRLLGADTNDTKGQLSDYYSQYVKRSGNRPNFIGLDVIGDNSIIHPSYDRQNGIRGVFDDLQAGVATRKKINQEAKSFIERIESECEQRVLNRDSKSAKHH